MAQFGPLTSGGSTTAPTKIGGVGDGCCHRTQSMAWYYTGKLVGAVSTRRRCSRPLSQTYHHMPDHSAGHISSQKVTFKDGPLHAMSVLRTWFSKWYCSTRETYHGIPMHATIGIPAVGKHTAGIPDSVANMPEYQGDWHSSVRNRGCPRHGIPAEYQPTYAGLHI